MFKNNKLVKVLALVALCLPSVPLFASPDVKTPASATMGELLGGAAFANLVELPAVEEIKLPEVSFEKLQPDTRANAPQPGRDFTPRIEDPARIKAIMKLITDVYNGVHLPYAQDGSTFKNKEGKLPVQPVGFYKEYTLLTGNAPHTVVIGGTTYQVAPDLSARGSERVIIGGGARIYFTPDHYAHFIELTVVN